MAASEYAVHARRSVPESFSRLRGLYAELPGLSALGDSDCDSCKTIVSQAVAILQARPRPGQMALRRPCLLGSSS